MTSYHSIRVEDTVDSAHGLRNSHGTCIPMEYDKMEDQQLQETSNDKHC